MSAGASERVYRTILVPLDGSKAAEAVLELGKNLAVRSGAALTMMNVCPAAQEDYQRMHDAYIQQAASLAQRDISRMCETIHCHFDGVTATAQPVLVRGEPAEEIVSYAEKNNVSVILMATHGRSAPDRSVMSDIANRVVRNSLTPVWLVRTLRPEDIVCAEWPPQRVLVPLDGSPAAEKVLPHAVGYASLFDAELVLLRVCEQTPIAADYPEASMSTSWEDHVSRMSSHYQAQCSLYLGGVTEHLKKTGVKVATNVILGNPAEEIIGYIRQNRCDLVAMTTVGRTGVAQWFSGSPLARGVFSNVTEQVLAATSRGILLARG